MTRPNIIGTVYYWYFKVKVLLKYNYSHDFMFIEEHVSRNVICGEDPVFGPDPELYTSNEDFLCKPLIRIRSELYRIRASFLDLGHQYYALTPIVWNKKDFKSI